MKKKCRGLGLCFQTLRWLFRWLFHWRLALSVPIKQALVIYNYPPSSMGLYPSHLWLRSPLLSNIIQRFQNKALWLVVEPLGSYETIPFYTDLRVLIVAEVIYRLSLMHERHLHSHPSALAIDLLDNSPSLHAICVAITQLISSFMLFLNFFQFLYFLLSYCFLFVCI